MSFVQTGQIDPSLMGILRPSQLLPPEAPVLGPWGLGLLGVGLALSGAVHRRRRHD